MDEREREREMPAENIKLVKTNSIAIKNNAILEEKLE